MAQPVKEQATKVWQTITAPETAETYKKTGALTWGILKDTGYLLWLVLCLGLVVWKTGYKTGWDVREWVNNLDKTKPELPTADSGKSVLESLKTTMGNTLAAARNQLGIAETDMPELPKVETPVVTAAQPEPVKPAVSEPKPVAPVEPTVTSVPVEPASPPAKTDSTL